MDYNIKTWMICITFILGVQITSFIFFGNTLSDLVYTANSDGTFLGLVYNAVSYLWSFVAIMFGALFFVLPSQADVPFIFSLIILVPYYSAMLYIIAPIMERMADLVVPDWI